MFVRTFISRNRCIFSLAILIAAGAFLMMPVVYANEILTLDEAVQLAITENPGLGRKQARAEAMDEIPSQAGALPDPRLNLGALNVPVDTYDLGQEAMTQLQIGISQEFPLFGTRKLRRQTAGHEARAAAHETDEARLTLIRDVKSAWWRIFYLDRALEIVKRNRVLLNQFVKIATTKYKVGRGLQQDVLLAQLEFSKLMDTEIQLKNRRRVEVVRLNAMLNRPGDGAITLPIEISESLPAPISETDLYDTALGMRPLLRARHSMVEAARRRHDLARKEYKPNMNLGVAYGFRDGTNVNGAERPDFATVRLSFNLPIYPGAKQDKAVAQRAKEINESDLALQEARQQVMAEIGEAYANYRQARSQAGLFKTGIIPQASQTVASMLSAYQVNKVDFLNLVRSQLTLYDYEMQYWQALSSANRALATLTAAVGKEEIYE